MTFSGAVLRVAQVSVLLGVWSTAAFAEVDFGDDDSRWARDGECDDPRFEGDGMAATLLEEDLLHDATDCRKLFDAQRIRLKSVSGPIGRVERGRLRKGDERLSSGEYADTFELEGGRGERAVIDLRSEQFDPYLIVRTPSGKQLDNDDFDGDAGRSIVALQLSEAGTYTVTVTSYREGETGAYTLDIRIVPGAAALASSEYFGRLEDGDETLTSGEYVDSYDFTGWPGQRVTIDLRSDAFDTYVILRNPDGKQTENDDAEDGGGAGHSRIDAELSDAGTYRVLVTSYEPGQTGPYRLTIGPPAAGSDEPPREPDVTLLVAAPRGGVRDSR
jgi:hypothetical protein